jgi:hypothetical protein
MSEQLPEDFRSSDEMLTIYREREAEGLHDQPYLIDVTRGNQRLVFFGSRHSNDVADRQVQEIETEWQRFIANHNNQKLAICEGGIRQGEMAKDDAIKQYSEAGLLTWLAREANINIISPEPDANKEIAHLHEVGFDTPNIVTYYFGRQMYQWLKRDNKTQPDWRPYAEFFVSKHASTMTSSDDHITLDAVLGMFEVATGKPFDAQAEALLYQVSDPSVNPVSAASGLYRDISLLAAIAEAWGARNDIFAVYGSGHAIVLEKALRRLGN